jgi:guanylate kinase
MAFDLSRPETYQPNDTALQALRAVELVAVVGPSGVGKTTLMKRASAANPNIHFVITDVSRSARAGEQDGVDYYFQSRADMLRLADTGAYVQLMVHPSGDVYATRPDSYRKGSINMMAVLADEIPKFRQLPFSRARTIFVVPPDFATWQQRRVLHNFTDEQNSKRLDEARRSFSFALSDPDTLFVVNDDLTKALSDFNYLIVDSTLTAERNDQQIAARTLVRHLLIGLE